MLAARMDFLQQKIEILISDVGQLATRIVEINELIANHMAEKSSEAREVQGEYDAHRKARGHKDGDVRAD